MKSPILDEVPVSRLYNHWFWEKFYKRRFKLAKDLLWDDVISRLGFPDKKRYENGLDFGTGNGIFIWEMDKIVKNCYASDIHSDFGKIAEFLFENHIKCTLVKSERSKRLGFKDDFFGVIVAISVLEEVENLKFTINELSRLIRKDGILIAGFPVETPITRIRKWFQPKETKQDFHINDYRTIITKLGQYFTIEKIYKYIPNVPLSLSMYVVVRCRQNYPAEVKKAVKKYDSSWEKYVDSGASRPAEVWSSALDGVKLLENRSYRHHFRIEKVYSIGKEIKVKDEQF